MSLITLSMCLEKLYVGAVKRGGFEPELRFSLLLPVWPWTFTWHPYASLFSLSIYKVKVIATSHRLLVKID